MTYLDGGGLVFKLNILVPHESPRGNILPVVSSTKFTPTTRRFQMRMFVTTSTQPTEPERQRASKFVLFDRHHTADESGVSLKTCVESPSSAHLAVEFDGPLEINNRLFMVAFDTVIIACE